VGYWVWDKSLAHSTQSGGVIALSARSGQVLWRRPLLDNRVSEPVFASDRRAVFVSSEDGNLRAIDVDSGEVRWSHRESMPIIGRPVIRSSGDEAQVIVGSLAGSVRSLDATDGRVVWSFQTGNWLTGAAALFQYANRDLLVIGSYDQILYCLDARTGTKIWAQRVDGPIYSAPAIADAQAGPVVVFAAWDHRIYGLDGRDGRVLWRVQTGQPLWSGIPLRESYWASPIVARVGGADVIFFGSYDGTFHAFALRDLAMHSGGARSTGYGLFITLVAALAIGALAALFTGRKTKTESSPST
jgi:outer membrane protein assembly factor BamB